MRGRKPVPTALKIIRGNPGRRPLKKDEPKPEIGIPKCPKWIVGEAKKEWKRVSVELEKLGLLSRIDGTALASYCQAYVMLKKATDVIEEKGLTCRYVNKDGDEYESKRPEVDIAFKAMHAIKVFCVEFGLTPSSRGRMSVPLKKETDSFEEFLKTGKVVHG